MFSSRFTDNDVKAFVLHDHFLNRFCPVDLDLIGQKIKMLLIDKVANLVEQIKVQVSFGGFSLDAVWLICRISGDFECLALSEIVENFMKSTFFDN